MSRHERQVLVIEDTASDLEYIRDLLGQRGRLAMTHAGTLAAGMALLRGRAFDVVLLDLSLPDSGGIETLLTLRAAAPGLPIIVMTRTDDDLIAVEAARLGAQLYLVKGELTAGSLVRSIELAIEHIRIGKERDRLSRDLQTIMDNLPGIAFLKDRQSRYVRVNRRFTEYREHGPEAVEGCGDEDIHPEERAAQILAEDRVVFETGEPLRVEHHSTINDSVFEIIKVPLKDAAGVVQGIVGIGIEVTERVRAIEALTESEGRYRRLAENLPDLIWRTDIDGNILFVNDAVTGFLGYPPGETVGKPMVAYFTPASIENVGRWFREALKGEREKGRFFGEVEYLHRDGRRVPGELHAALVYGADGRAIALEGVTRDITERRAAREARAKLEEQLEHARKLDAVGQLAGGVAHDFNNILSVILSNAGFILEDLPEGHASRADAVEIKKAAQRAAGLTRQLLAFSRKEHTEPKTVAVDEAVRDIVKMLGRLIGEHVRLQLDLAAGGACITIDPTQLEQIVINLSLNARDAMPGGGTLTVATRVDAPGACPAGWPGGAVVLTVTDTGIGMSKGIVAKIFEPFFTTKPVGKGTGLGLSMVYGAVQQNRGRIEVDSEPGRGTTFRLYFEAISPDAVGERADSGEIRSPVPGAILLVEDEEPVRRAVARMLRGAGHAVTEAACGEDALARYRAPGARFDIVLTDMIMPGMGGVALAREIRGENPGQKIVFQSGYSEDFSGRQGALAPGDVVLMKPVSKRDLLTALEGMLCVKG